MASPNPTFCPEVFVGEPFPNRPPCPSYATAALVPHEVSTAIVFIAGFLILAVVVLLMTIIVLWSIGDP